MRKETLIRKIEASVDKINEALDNISDLLEIDSEDDYLAQMSAAFIEQVENAVTQNEECNIDDIINYLKEEA
jgi:hypothetical protein